MNNIKSSKKKNLLTLKFLRYKDAVKNRIFIEISCNPSNKVYNLAKYPSNFTT